MINKEEMKNIITKFVKSRYISYDGNDIILYNPFNMNSVVFNFNNNDELIGMEFD